MEQAYHLQKKKKNKVYHLHITVISIYSSSIIQNYTQDVGESGWAAEERILGKKEGEGAEKEMA